MRRGRGDGRAFHWGALGVGGRRWQGGRSGLLPPRSLHQLGDGAADGPPSVHHFAIETDGLACLPHLVTERSRR